MLGAIAGDVIGSVYEAAPIKSKDFPLFGDASTFTDDTVCTAAVADWLLHGGDVARYLRRWGRQHPWRGYGGMFARWLADDSLPAYGSWGNGAAMRVTPCAYLAAGDDEALRLAEAACVVSHDHPQAVRGAKAVVLAIRLAGRGEPPARVRDTIAACFGYDLDASVAEIRPGYAFDVSTAGTVPPALICALEAKDFEDAVRNAVSLGGDADTLACIAGGVAEARFGVPDAIATEVEARLSADLLVLLERFRSAVAVGRYGR